MRVKSARTARTISVDNCERLGMIDRLYDCLVIVRALYIGMWHSYYKMHGLMELLLEHCIFACGTLIVIGTG